MVFRLRMRGNEENNIGRSTICVQYNIYIGVENPYIFFCKISLGGTYLKTYKKDYIDSDNIDNADNIDGNRLYNIDKRKVKK
jgi:hypothetical protein